MRQFQYILILLSGLPFMVSGQVSDESKVEANPLIYSADRFLQVPDFDKASINKPDIRINAGTSFISFQNHGSVVSSYINPDFTFKASPKFRIHAGVVATKNMFNNVSENSESFFIPPPSNSLLIYAGGEYFINDRITLSGMAFKETATGIVNDVRPLSGDLNYQGMTLGLNYKITENIHFGAQLHMNEGNNPLNYNPYRMYRSPYESISLPNNW